MNESQEVILLKDRDWSIFDGKVCRVLEFTPLTAIVKDGRVKTSRLTMPYTLIVIECPIIQGNARGYITHKIDFAMLWAAFNERTHVKGARTEVRNDRNGVLAFEANHRLALDEEVRLMWTIERYRLWSALIYKFLPRLIVSVHLIAE